MRREIVYTATSAFLLNLLWELSHYQLYNDFSGIPKYPHILLASITDALIITAILFIIFTKKKRLFSNPSKTDYIIIISSTLIIAIVIELIAIKTGRWSYKEGIPQILGLGLSPLLQLAVTAVLSLNISKKLSGL